MKYVWKGLAKHRKAPEDGLAEHVRENTERVFGISDTDAEFGIGGSIK